MNIKRIVTVSLILTTLLAALILSGTVIYGQKNQQQPETSLGLAATEVFAHNSSTDCWVVVNSKVYNVTEFLNLHPAGPDKIVPLCGKDASDAFNNKGGKGPHSQKALEVLSNYYLGELK